MPRHSRTTSDSHSTSHRVHSYNTANQAAQLYATQHVPTSYYTIPSQSLSQSQAVYSSFESQPSPTPIAAASSAPEKPSSANRSGSAAWSPADDAKLISARTAGLNWSQIRETYFPSKSPNACRKRHERLMDRKTTATDWDARKMHHLAKEYMNLRKEIWQPLAQRTGEKWNVVEQKCMSNGLKNLQSAARSANRLERYEQASDFHSANTSHTGYDDDSGVSGIGLTPVDEAEQYSSPEECVSVNQSFAAVTGGGLPTYSQPHAIQYAQHRQQQPQMSAQLQPLNVQYSMQTAYAPTQYAPVHQHRYSSSASSNASLSHPFVSRGGQGSSQGSSPYMDEQRLV